MPCRIQCWLSAAGTGKALHFMIQVILVNVFLMIRVAMHLVFVRDPG